MVRIKSIPKKVVVPEVNVFFGYEVKNPTVFDTAMAQLFINDKQSHFGIATLSCSVTSQQNVLVVLLKYFGNPDRVFDWLHKKLPDVNV